MKTNRRGFLGLFGAAAVAAPTVASASMNEVLNAPVGGYAVSGLDIFGNATTQPPTSEWVGGQPSKHDQISWAKGALKGLVGKTPQEKHREMLRMEVYQYDPNIVTLRSVSVTTRIRMSRKALYARQLEREKFNLEGVIRGWW